MDLTDQKALARQVAFRARKVAHAKLGAEPTTKLSQILAPFTAKTLAAYLPIRTEISPLSALRSHLGPVCVPVIQKAGSPLKFARWTLDTELVSGPFGTQTPKDIEYLTPEILIVPLVAFDEAGNRLGYGGGFYDRTLEALRKNGPTLAIGYAYEAQRQDDLPLEQTDQPLDFIITEEQTRHFPR